MLPAAEADPNLDPDTAIRLVNSSLASCTGLARDLDQIQLQRRELQLAAAHSAATVNPHITQADRYAKHLRFCLDVMVVAVLALSIVSHSFTLSFLNATE